MTNKPLDKADDDNRARDDKRPGAAPDEPILTGELDDDILDDDELAASDRLSADEDLEVELVPLEGEEVESDDVTDDDDDNPYGESDEALPDDAEERSLRRDPSREGGRFGED